MNRKLLVLWQCLFLFVPILSYSEQLAEGLNTPVKLVSEFQKVENYELNCVSKILHDTDPVNTKKIFKFYLSTDFLKLFIWAQCGEPNTPPFYDYMERAFSWDIRYGIRNGPSEGIAQNIRVRPAKFSNANQAVVIVNFGIEGLDPKNIMTTYTLIREEGQWKIDDIAPKGDSLKDTGIENGLWSSASIKTDMQSNYNKALERYQKEQAAKGATPKP